VPSHRLIKSSNKQLAKKRPTVFSRPSMWQRSHVLLIYINEGTNPTGASYPPSLEHCCTPNCLCAFLIHAYKKGETTGCVAIIIPRVRPLARVYTLFKRPLIVIKNSQLRDYSDKRATTKFPAVVVELTDPVPAISAVLTPAEMAEETANSTACASFSRPKECLKSMATLRIVA